MIEEVFIEFFVPNGRPYENLFCDVFGFVVTKRDDEVCTLEYRQYRILIHENDDLPQDHFFYGVLDSRRRGIGVEFCLGVNDLDKALSRTQALGFNTTEIVAQTWGLRDFRIMTSEGYYIRVTEPRDSKQMKEIDEQVSGNPGLIFNELYVSDIDSAIKLFVNALGFRLLRNEGDFAELRSINSIILLNTNVDYLKDHPFSFLTSKDKDRGIGVEIGIVVQDLEATREIVIREGITEITPIKSQSWGLRDFRFHMADGYYIRVTEGFA